MTELKRSHLNLLEIVLFFLLILSLFIPNNLTNVLPWCDLTLLSYFKFSIWLFFSSFLLGFYFLRILKISDCFTSRISQFTIASNLSLAILGLLTLVFYALNISLYLFPYFLLFLIIALKIGCFFYRAQNSYTKINWGKWGYILLVSILFSIFIAGLIQYNKQYLLSGDVWVSLKAGVDILAGPSLYSHWGQTYPFMFGFILSGVSLSAGFPILNTYVLMFPLIALPILTFYTLLREAFQQGSKTATLSVILISFTGGFGWLYTFFSPHNLTFWEVSLITQDGYFNEFFWYGIEFTYKSLALSIALASIMLCFIAIKNRNLLNKFFILLISAFLICFSFFIHMIEPLFAFPVAIFILFIYKKHASFWVNLSIFLSSSLVFYYLLDFLTDNYYSYLLEAKTHLLFSINLQPNYLILFTVLLILSISLFLAFKKPANPFIYLQNKLFHGSLKLNLHYPNVLKCFIVLLLLVLYIFGIYFWTIRPTFDVPIYDLTPLPWYFLVMRFGLIGLLAVISLVFVRWRDKWFLTSIFWFSAVLFVGTFFLGARFTSYLSPIVALLAAICIHSSWEKINAFSKSKDVTKLKKALRFNSKYVLSLTLLAVLALSSSTFLFGVNNYYIKEAPSMSDDSARVFNWLYQNTPKNVSVLVPDFYSYRLGVITIASRGMIPYSQLNSIENIDDFDVVLTFLQSKNVFYILSYTDQTEADSLSPIVYSLVLTSKLVYQTETLNVYQLFDPDDLL